MAGGPLLMLPCIKHPIAHKGFVEVGRRGMTCRAGLQLLMKLRSVQPVVHVTAHRETASVTQATLAVHVKERFAQKTVGSVAGVKTCDLPHLSQMQCQCPLLLPMLVQSLQQPGTRTKYTGASVTPAGLLVLHLEKHSYRSGLDRTVLSGGVPVLMTP